MSFVFIGNLDVLGASWSLLATILTSGMVLGSRMSLLELDGKNFDATWGDEVQKHRASLGCDVVVF